MVEAGPVGLGELQEPHHVGGHELDERDAVLLDRCEELDRIEPRRGDDRPTDAVDDILKIETVPVIFITAYPERLLTGDRPEPTYLITKPFKEESVRAAIAQALFFGCSRQLS